MERMEEMISIHAPRVGSDSIAITPRLNADDFNPRSPCGERRWIGDYGFSPYVISIHAPRVGSDHDFPVFHQRLKISIHAPRVGSDSKTAQILLEILSHLNSFAPSEKKKIPFHRKEQGKFIEIF